LIKELELDVVYDGDSAEIDITTSDINRPGLQFSGFFDYFAQDRIQIIGKVEMTYLEFMEPGIRDERLDRFFSHDIPCAIISRNMEVPDYIMKAAARYKRPILRSKMVTTSLIHKLIIYIDSVLAPTTTRHGVLVDVYGVGVLLMGESGIGKSETALELVKRGHRLVADDAVDIKRVAENRLIGESPPLIRHFMEIRGVGIIDVKAMYGVGAVINNKPLDIVIFMEIWDNKKEYDRLGLSQEYSEILGVKLPKIVIPVRPGRNLAIIVEVAARSWRLKNMGYFAAHELNDRLNTLINSGVD
jgi:HPr kinase/phosphorylase